MANIKTAVSIHENLFRQAESMAREMRLSRSGLISKALEEYIKRHQNRQLLDRLNEAYSGQPGGSERQYLRKMGRRHRKLIEDQW